ncbi:MAG: hypothetical protein M1822_006790 [Bathelium mastoideum]|nr:MAG: hypothetical protein M1822_006790 [Bathelium mastoideum]
MQNRQQFSRVPKFSLHPSQRSSKPATPQRPAPSQTPSRPPPRFWSQTPAQRNDSIDSSSSPSDTELPSDPRDGQPHFVNSDDLELNSDALEPDRLQTSDEIVLPNDDPPQGTTIEYPFHPPMTPSSSSKRRRLLPPSTTRPSRPSFLPPAKPSSVPLTSPSPALSTNATPARRYVLPHASSPTGSTTAEIVADPVPELFSPRRRGKQYLAGGIADTLRGWVIEAGEQAAHGHEHGQGRGRSQQGNVVRIEAAQGGMGMTMVRGRQGTAVEGGRAVNMLLVGDGAVGHSRGRAGESVGQGTMVECRAPVWSVALGEQEWWVAAGWRRVEKPSYPG